MMKFKQIFYETVVRILLMVSLFASVGSYFLSLAYLIIAIWNLDNQHLVSSGQFFATSIVSFLICLLVDFLDDIHRKVNS